MGLGDARDRRVALGRSAADGHDQPGMTAADVITETQALRPGGGRRLPSADTLRSNLRAAEIAWTEELERRLAPLEEDTDRYWGRRAELVWN
jgi:hypothetical protein